MTNLLSKLLAVATLILLLAGGLVTSTDSGLAVPDWPLSYGGLFPPMVGGIRFEHTHRLLGAFVGLLTFAFMVVVGRTEARASVRRLAIAAFGLVVLQGILGGLTVLFLLPKPISIAHACIGPVFFSLAVALAILTKEREKSPSPLSRSPFRRLALFFTASVFLQILLGAIVRHTGEGMGFHVASAFVVLILAGRLVAHALISHSVSPRLLRPAAFLTFLVVVEFFLGIGAFIFTRRGGSGPFPLAQVLFPTLHQILGALLLGMGTFLTLRPEREPRLVLEGGARSPR